MSHSMPCWVSNPRPSQHGSPPITNRPGLQPPYDCNLQLWSCTDLKFAYFTMPNNISLPISLWSTNHNDKINNGASTTYKCIVIRQYMATTNLGKDRLF